MTEQTREEVDAKLATAEARVEVRLTNLEMSMKTGFAEQRTDMERLRGEIQKSTGHLIKWGVALSFAVIGTTVGLLHFISKTS